MAKSSMNTTLEAAWFMTDWIWYWVMVGIVWVISGYIIYLLWVWFYKLRIKWSKWEDSPLLAKKIYIYNILFVALVSIVITICDTFYYSSPVLSYKNTESWYMFESYLSVLVCVLLFHSLYISYKWVMLVPNIKKWRALIWFVILPAIFYSFVLIWSILLLLLK